MMRWLTDKLALAFIFAVALGWLPWIVLFGSGWYIEGHYLQEAPRWALGLAHLIELVGALVCYALNRITDMHSELFRVNDRVVGRLDNQNQFR
jgi:hypothetical protein